MDDDEDDEDKEDDGDDSEDEDEECQVKDSVSRWRLQPACTLTIWADHFLS